MTKVMTVVGARPQFIKAAAVSRAVGRRAGLEEVLVHTGQHFDSNMSDVFFRELDIPPPQVHLGIHGGSHGAMTGAMLARLEEVLLAEKPDWLLVYGDTNSTLAGALAAVKLHVRVAHVEAGLRSFNRIMPEEINRVLTDHAADLLFVPTEAAHANLVAEGLGERVRRVGDVMFDAAQYYASRAPERCDAMRSLALEPRGFLLATIHRAENTDSEPRLRSLIECLNAASTFLPVVLPLHPRTRQALTRMSPAIELAPKIHLVDPVGYFDMVSLERNAAVIATDSGGVQKEAYFHKTPCITLREETEWIELVTSGWNVLVGADVERFRSALRAFTGGAPPSWSTDLYGDGHAAEAIVQQLVAT